MSNAPLSEAQADYWQTEVATHINEVYQVATLLTGQEDKAYACTIKTFQLLIKQIQMLKERDDQTFLIGSLTWKAFQETTQNTDEKSTQNNFPLNPLTLEERKSRCS